VKIYTRTGDTGETALFDGRRVPKADLRVDAYGEIDELNATIGVLLAEPEYLQEDVEAMLEEVQRDLFAVGGRLADPGKRIAERVEKVAIGAADVARVEGWIDTLEAELTPLSRFILPGGIRAAALAHLARTVCRRAERRMVLLGPHAFEAELLAYVNRLSDFLFVLARVLNRRAGVAESEW
jgi:cob(I)alamin adenosyltransferase